jgi:hypothetical protein
MYLVLLHKIFESQGEAEYSYGESESTVGRLRLDKGTGEISLVQLATGDADQALFTRAAWKLEEHWEEGKLPDMTCWAS